jgi:uncharacterized protein (TIGR03437 family)
MKFIPKGRRLSVTAFYPIVAFLACVVLCLRMFEPQATAQQDLMTAADLVPEAEGGGYIISDENGQRVCREAESSKLMHPDPGRLQSELRVIYGGSARSRLQADAQQSGLRITLRATSQLDSFPEAKAAFIRAAQNWESQIATPISIIIDVDYGTTFFGENYSNTNVIGQTSSQSLGSSNGYNTFRAALIARASSANESALYNRLPGGQLPTDQGDLTAVFGASPLLRALGLLGPNADPDAEQQFGGPPRIGFNSAVPFDFDPNDGVSSNRIDFDGTATHEIGHALGFSSAVGDKELNPSAMLRASPLDFFRFRPGVNLDAFPSAQRILASGGAQIFFGGGPELGLSTGRPDGTGGDGNQASHWKADEQTGVYLGVMDPTASRGQREPITQNDLAAFDTLGYRLSSGGSALAAVSAASFRGAELTSESIASAFGQNLATGTASASTATLPTTLAGATVNVRDSAGAERLAPLFFASPDQINFLLPAGTAPGLATITAGRSGAMVAGVINIVSVAPGLFSANSDGQGVASAVVLRVRAGGAQSFESITTFDPSSGRMVAAPIDLGPAGDQVFLILFGTGLRQRSSLAAVTARIGDAPAAVSFAGAQSSLFGLDQVNMLIPRSLAGRGAVNIVLTVDGKNANAVSVSIR